MIRLSCIFGFRSAAEGERKQRSRLVFEAVAPCYDDVNDIKTMGIRLLWTRKLVRLAAPQAGQLIVALAARMAGTDRMVADGC